MSQQSCAQVDRVACELSTDHRFVLRWNREGNQDEGMCFCLVDNLNRETVTRRTKQLLKARTVAFS
ncbi:MAG: hypothetical protein OEU36_18785 [Gammaproteobacteria bacterium]|nr:hypothetical protein [Gammaproteobacteria bacterium]